MTIKELYELAKKENAEDYNVIIVNTEEGGEDWEVTGLAFLHKTKKIFI